MNHLCEELRVIHSKFSVSETFVTKILNKKSVNVSAFSAQLVPAYEKKNIRLMIDRSKYVLHPAY